MSTRAIYSFFGDQGTIHVYKHHDGYPSGAAQHIEAALTKAWPLPRYENDEFAAAFVAANKNDAGGIRLIAAAPATPANQAAQSFASDIEYRYEIRAVRGVLQITAFETQYWKALIEKRIFKGTLDAMTNQFAQV